MPSEALMEVEDLTDYKGFEWLGYDLVIENGDFVFGADGDLKSHDNPLVSFSEVLKHKSQVAGNLVHDVFPRRIPVAIRAAANAIAADPRVAGVRILGGAWRQDENNQADIRYYVVRLALTLASGDTINNLVLPVYRVED